MLERVKGIEPSYSAWKAAALPLSYTRAAADGLFLLSGASAKGNWRLIVAAADAANGRVYKCAGEKTKTPGARPGVVDAAAGRVRTDGGVDQKATRTPLVKAVLFGSVQAVPSGRLKPLAMPPRICEYITPP